MAKLALWIHSSVLRSWFFFWKWARRNLSWRIVLRFVPVSEHVCLASGVEFTQSRMEFILLQLSYWYIFTCLFWMSRRDPFSNDAGSSVRLSVTRADGQSKYGHLPFETWLPLSVETRFVLGRIEMIIHVSFGSRRQIRRAPEAERRKETKKRRAETADRTERLRRRVNGAKTTWNESDDFFWNSYQPKSISNCLFFCRLIEFRRGTSFVPLFAFILLCCFRETSKWLDLITSFIKSLRLLLSEQPPPLWLWRCNVLCGTVAKARLCLMVPFPLNGGLLQLLSQYRFLQRNSRDCRLSLSVHVDLPSCLQPLNDAEAKFWWLDTVPSVFQGMILLLRSF